MTTELVNSINISGLVANIVADKSAEKTNISVVFPEVLVEVGKKGEKTMQPYQIGRKSFSKLNFALSTVEQLPEEIKAPAQAGMISTFFKQETSTELWKTMTELSADPAALFAAITREFEVFDEATSSGSSDPRNNIVNMVAGVPELVTAYDKGDDAELSSAILAYVKTMLESADDLKWVKGRISEKDENNGRNQDGTIKLRGKKKEEKAS